MFRVILLTQWKWTRGVLLFVTCATFALPFLALRNASRALGEMDARNLLASMDAFGVFFALAAAFLGLTVAAISWTPDHTGRHVYALSLPIERWRYVAMRFGAGAITLLPPAIALWIGGVIALMSTALPPGLHSHPGTLAVRFCVAALLAYAIFFAISSGTKRTAGIILAVIAVLIVGDMAGVILDLPFSPFSTLYDLVLNWSGTLGVFNGRWMLIDV